MIGECAQNWDFILALREIDRKRPRNPRVYADRRHRELLAAPWKNNMDDWRGRRDAFLLIAMGKVSWETIAT
jgi:hypothetical protein